MHGHTDWSAARASEIIAAEKGREGPLLPILHGFMEAFGYVPEPAGRHVVKLCRAESCQSAGCEELAAHLEDRLGISFGETTVDGQVTLEPIYCLGLCALSPAAMIDDRIVARLDKTKLDAALGEVGR